MQPVSLSNDKTIPVLAARALVLGNHQAEFHLGNLGKSPCPHGALLYKGREYSKHLQSSSFSGDSTILWFGTGAYRFHCLSE